MCISESSQKMSEKQIATHDCELEEEAAEEMIRLKTFLYAFFLSHGLQRLD